MANDTDLDAALELLEAKLKDQQADPIGAFRPYPKQQLFIEATAEYTEVALQAANQIGKTLTAAWLLSVWLTGRYPPGFKGRRFHGPVNARAAGVTTSDTATIMQGKLCGPGAPGEEGWNTGLLPPSSIVSHKLGHGVSGALASITVRHAGGGLSTLDFKSMEMGRTKFQGASLDVVWLDEECPIDIYTECLARTIATAGIVISTFTPLTGNFEVLDRFTERSPEALRNRHRVHMTARDAAHLESPEAQERLLAMFSPHERRARLEGLPLLGSGAVFDFDHEQLVSPLRLVGTEIVHDTLGPIESDYMALLWGVDFGIFHPFAAVLAAYDRNEDVVFVLKCFKMAKSTPVEHVSRMRSIAPNVKVVFPHDGAAHEKGSGMQLAEIYRKEGALMHSTHSTWAKGGYDFEAGVEEMRLRMISGRLFISRDCWELFDEISTYRRDQNGRVVKKHDDALSALRQIIMMLRAAKPAKIGPYRGYDVSGSGGPRAAGTDDYYFGID